MNNVTNEDYVRHEVELRVLNFKNDVLYQKVESLDSKLESRFLMLVALIITSIVVPVVLHSLKLV